MSHQKALKRLLILPGLVMVLVHFSIPQAQAVVLDWANLTWPNANSSTAPGFHEGAVTGASFEVDSSHAGSDVTVSISVDSATLYSGIDDGYGAGTTPSLKLAMNNNNKTDSITVTVNFSSYSTGVSNVNFTLYDIDKANGSKDYVDQVRTITARTKSGNTIIGAVQVSGSPGYNTVSGSGTTTMITGTKYNEEQNTLANAYISFGTNVITSFSFTYGDASDATMNSPQWISLSAISYNSRVPEMGTALGAVLLCGVAVGYRRIQKNAGSRPN